ncbi:hypothetical protein B1A99_00535 [Cohnella sp. CIP 111063]|uniref:hypothetical protein n=1 Tax=unclassified Cohnella TaxID=2636738 RepID=UPI000B8C07DF|nr:MULTISPECIES: hypothetical protein [unclassified Cohnella]OXS62390.1 hypothetical protein B1A99_00535 [Cohnella sp. CIP 111063]PRX74625.1 hypothetical protein B0G52_101110 [Cohnella sp. SGD-V74]
MPEVTSHLGLKKPLENEIADISIINENMDMIDLTLGDLGAVPTAAKTVAGAIEELHETIQDIDISDGAITPAKLSFDPATQTELDAHANATSVHGATNAPTASRLIIRDAAGRAKVAAPAASDDIARLDSITKIQVSLGNVDNYGTATQVEAEAGTATNKFMTPQRTKQAIDKFTGSVPLRVSAGELEYFDGTVWKKVGGDMSRYKKLNILTGLPSTNETPSTLVNVTGKAGYLTRAWISGNNGSGVSMKQFFEITIDGTITYHTLITSTATSTGVSFRSGIIKDNQITGYDSSNSLGLRMPGSYANGVLYNTMTGGVNTIISQYPYVNTTLTTSATYSRLVPIDQPLFFSNSLMIRAYQLNTYSSAINGYEISYVTE